MPSGWWSFWDWTANLSFTSLNVGLRAVVVFLAGLLILRLGNRRFMGKSTAFDVVESAAARG